MPYIIIGVLVLIAVLYIVIKFLEKADLKKMKNEAHIIINNYGQIIHENKKALLKINDETYFLLFFWVPKNAELIINSPKIWEIRKGSTKQFVKIEDYIMKSYQSIVVIYPNTQPIKRYINENEMVFIKSTDLFNNMHVMHFNEIELFLSKKKGEFS